MPAKRKSTKPRRSAAGRSAAKKKTTRSKTPAKSARATTPGEPKLDVYAQHRADYVTPRRPVLLGIDPARYLAISGSGRPGGDEFNDAIGALYGVAFTVKMARKKAGQDYTVSKLEGLWSREPGFVSSDPLAGWSWELIIRLPDFITADEVAGAARMLRARGKSDSVSRVRLISLDEGDCVQMLHVGPYTEEEPTIAAMRAHAAEHRLAFTGRHHEIYLSDPRRVPAARLRTILRYPVGPE